jgi:hypothetical protein
MIEEVFDGGDALFSERRCDLRADAFDKLNRGVELNHFAMLSGAARTATRAFGAIPPLAFVKAPSVTAYARTEYAKRERQDGESRLIDFG